MYLSLVHKGLGGFFFGLGQSLAMIKIELFDWILSRILVVEKWSQSSSQNAACSRRPIRSAAAAAAAAADVTCSRHIAVVDLTCCVCHTGAAAAVAKRKE